MAARGPDVSAGRVGLSVVTVAWSSAASLQRCAESLAGARPLARDGADRFELVVVDNDCPDLDETRLRSVWPDLVLIRNAANLGFGPAANQGVAASRGEFVLLLNPDTRAQGSPFDTLVAAFSATPGAVAVAPRLVDAEATNIAVTGESQEVFQLRHLPTLGQAMRELLLIDKAWPRNRWFRRDRYLDRSRDGRFDVEQPAASALAVRRDVFLELGGFDPRFAPAWFEDVDLCKRLLTRGRIVFLPDCVLLHEGGEAARRLGYDSFLPIYYRNARRYWRKHHGRAGAALYRGLLTAGMMLRLAVLPFRRRLPRPRAQAARAYLHVLAGALGFERATRLRAPDPSAT